MKKSKPVKESTNPAAVPGMPVELWDAEQCARVLGVCEATARRLAYRGELRSVRVGSLLRFDPRDIVAYVERSKTAA